MYDLGHYRRTRTRYRKYHRGAVLGVFALLLAYYRTEVVRVDVLERTFGQGPFPSAVAEAARRRRLAATAADSDDGGVFVDDAAPFASRRLLIHECVNGTKVSQSTGHGNLPENAFSESQMEQGAVVLHILCMLYMFYGLAIICDGFFEPALKSITVALDLSDDVAGATFMAAGSSAPEFFSSFIGVFMAESDVGFGTIVGSAVFNVLIIIGTCAIAVPNLALQWYPLTRDTIFYCGAIIILVAAILNNKIDWYESLILFLFYVAYIYFMKKNEKVRRWTDRWLATVHDERGKWPQRVERVTESKIFFFFIMAVIVFNVVLLGLSFAGDESDWVDAANYACSAIFIMEFLLKHYATGIARYWQDVANSFDGILVMLIIFELGLRGSGGLGGVRGLRLFRVFRVFRGLRVVRLVQPTVILKNSDYTNYHKEMEKMILITKKNHVVPSANAAQVGAIMTPIRAKHLETPVSASVPLPETAHLLFPTELPDEHHVNQENFDHEELPPLPSDDEDTAGEGGKKKSKKGSSVFISKGKLREANAASTDDGLSKDDRPSTAGEAGGEAAVQEARAPEKGRLGMIKDSKDVEAAGDGGDESGSDSDDDEPVDPYDHPGCEEGCDFWHAMRWLGYLIQLPIVIVLYYTVPDCRQERFKRWYFVTFAMSIVWIALFSFLMIWMATEAGKTIGIPDSIMGLTILAAGTSVPDTLASLSAARDGKADQSVSNSLGSNVFDICFGLAVPWLLKSMIYGEAVPIESDSLTITVFILFITVALVVWTIHASKWILTAKLGWLYLFIYVVFVAQALLTEIGVIMQDDCPAAVPLYSRR